MSTTLANMRSGLKHSQEHVHPTCVVCGLRNTSGLHLEFAPSEDGGVEATFDCDGAFAGYPDCLHGGVIASLLDGAMTNCLFAHGLVGMTGELTVRFRESVATGSAATVRAWIERSSSRLHLLRAEVRQDGQAKATGTGKFMVVHRADGA